MRRIEIPKTVYFGGTQESQVDSAGLQQAHDYEHVEALRRVQQVRRIGHGIDQLTRRRGANHSIFKESNAIRRVSLLSNHKRDQRQTHAHENDLSVADLSRRCRSHEFAPGITHFAVNTAERLSM